MRHLRQKIGNEKIGIRQKYKVSEREERDEF